MLQVKKQSSLRVYLPILDKLYAKLNQRLQAYGKLLHKFDFLRNV